MQRKQQEEDQKNQEDQQRLQRKQMQNGKQLPPEQQGQQRRPGRLRDMGEYIKKALKFYDIRVENITPVIFSAILFVSFTGVFYPVWSPETAFLIVVLNILSVFAINIASAVYLYAAIQDLKGTPASLSNAFKIVISKIHVILTASIVLLIMTAAGFLLLLIPGIIIYITYIFNLCYITDKNSGFLVAFRNSSKLTKGRKMELFAIVFILNIVLGIPSAFIMLMAGSSPNPLIFNFVIAFVAAMTSLMLHKLTALLYFDLEYGKSSPSMEKQQTKQTK